MRPIRPQPVECDHRAIAKTKPEENVHRTPQEPREPPTPPPPTETEDRRCASDRHQITPMRIANGGWCKLATESARQHIRDAGAFLLGGRRDARHVLAVRPTSGCSVADHKDIWIAGQR